jgi:hypothetical protein
MGAADQEPVWRRRRLSAHSALLDLPNFHIRSDFLGATFLWIVTRRDQVFTMRFEAEGEYPLHPMVAVGQEFVVQLVDIDQAFGQVRPRLR